MIKKVDASGNVFKISMFYVLELKKFLNLKIYSEIYKLI